MATITTSVLDRLTELRSQIEDERWEVGTTYNDESIEVRGHAGGYDYTTGSIYADTQAVEYVVESYNAMPAFTALAKAVIAVGPLPTNYGLELSCVACGVSIEKGKWTDENDYATFPHNEDCPLAALIGAKTNG